jgi:hypothetical protein
VKAGFLSCQHAFSWHPESLECHSREGGNPFRIVVMDG